MKVLALNASPRTDGMSKTRLMLDALTEGMRDAGAEVDVVNLREKKISTCRGCMCCWTKTPGVCVLKDDMTMDLYPRWLDSDLAVYAFPLYHFTLNADMKAFVERTLPAIQPFFIAIGNETKVKVVKNKVAPPFKTAEFDILYGEGISRLGEIVDLGVLHKVVDKSGAWYAYGGEKIGQGRENSREFLRENPALAREIENKIRALLAVPERESVPTGEVPFEAD